MNTKNEKTVLKKGAHMPLPFDHVSRRTILTRSAGVFGLIMSGLFTPTSLAAFLSKPTPRQALGPFFPDDGDEVDAIRENPDPNLPISQANDQDLTFVKGRKGNAQGQMIYLSGQVLDAKTGQPIPDTVLIMWSASASGRYNHKGDEGRTVSHTPKPARPFIEPTTNISNIGERPPPTSKENIGLKPSCQDFIP